MARNYTHMKGIETQAMEMKAAGKKNQEISDHFGITKRQLENLIRRYNKKVRNQEAGIQPERRGRRPKGYVPTEDEKDNTIMRLTMENRLLRDFLRLAGRR